MASFCTNCGARLEDGEICACKKQAAPQQTTAQQAAPQQAAPQQATPQQATAPVAPNQVVLYLKGIWALIVKLFKAPATAGIEFTNSVDFKTALGLIGMQALAMSFLLMAFAGKMNSVLDSDYISIKFPIITIFFVSIIVTFAMGCILPAILMFIIKLFKGNTDYKHMLCISGVNSTMITPFILVGFLLSLIMPVNVTSSLSSPVNLLGSFVYPLIIAVLGNTLGAFAMLKVVKGSTDVDDDRSIYIMFLTGIVVSIALYLVMKGAMPMCTPSALSHY